VLGSPLGPLRAEVEAQQPSVIWERGTDFRLTGGRLALGGQQLDLETPNGTYSDLFLPLHGAHQADNAVTAVAAAEAFFGRAIEQEVVEEALGQVRVPGRFEVLGRSPTVIVDGAHNPDGARVARATLDAEFARLGSWVLVTGMLQGRDPVEVLEAFGVASFDAVICCQPTWSRALPAEEVAQAARSLGASPEVVADPLEALGRALAVTGDEDLILIAGSLYLVGEVRPALRAAAAAAASTAGDENEDDGFV
jgi:dihydrofolate synthase/folylpolyglutamate synthase